MKSLIRVILTVISLATIPPVANAADQNSQPVAAPQDTTTTWVNA